MTGGETTIVAGIEIPSTDPVFLAVVLGVHVPLGIACVAIGAIAMLSEKRRGRHSKFGTIYFWCLLTLFGVRDVPVAYALGRKLSLVYSRRVVIRLRLVRTLSPPASLALLGQASYRRDGAIVHSDAGCFLRRQWKASALEGPASFRILADTYGRRDSAHRSRASVAAVSESARWEFLNGRHPEYQAPGSRG
jgi:hypothetical protein